MNSAELVARLRDLDDRTGSPVAHEAADRIEALEAWKAEAMERESELMTLAHMDGAYRSKAEIARLQEQLAAQIDGHQLTAKEATANLLRANRIEAGLEEMTRSCLAERAGRLATEAERDRLQTLEKDTSDKFFTEHQRAERLEDAIRRVIDPAPGCNCPPWVYGILFAALQKEPQP